jgi:diguanylate cyclase (GGDEF)-like protein
MCGYGHPTGDKTIRSVCQVLTGSLRTSDILGRYGGEEFLMILPQTNVDGALIVAERLLQVVVNTVIPCNSLSLRVTLSLGGAALRQDTQSYEQIVHETDQALYLSKTAGRNCVHAFPQADSSTILHA